MQKDKKQDIQVIITTNDTKGLNRKFIDSSKIFNVIKGKIVEGYRYKDGIVTIEADNHKKYWCGESRTDIYRPYKEE